MKGILSHIAVWTCDIERSRMFYEQYFNGVSNEKYVNTAKEFSSYFVKFNGGAAIEIMQRKDIITPNEGYERIGLAHFAFTVGGKDNVNQLIELLRFNGYVINSEARTTGDGFYEASVLDPDENIIEIVAAGEV